MQKTALLHPERPLRVPGNEPTPRGEANGSEPGLSMCELPAGSYSKLASADAGSNDGSRLPLLALLADPEDPPPFAFKRVLLLLHLFRNLLALTTALERTGLDPARAVVAVKDYDYPAKDFVADRLRAAGYRLIPADNIDMLDGNLLGGQEDERILVIEDGGLHTSNILRHPTLANRCDGVVEQTTAGVRRIEAAAARYGDEIPFPVISVPHSRLKQRVEPPHIGEAAVRAVQCVLVHTAIRNYPCAVLGAGSIGSAVVDALAGQKVPVAFWDPDPETLLIAHTNLCGTAAASAAGAVKDARFVFGASGRQSVTADLIPYLRDGAWLISVSSETVEFDLGFLERSSSIPPAPIRRCDLGECVTDHDVVGTRYVVDGKVINVMNGGRPVNFRFAQMGDEVADLVLTQIFLGAVDLARGRFKGRRGILADAIDEVSRRHHVADTYLKLMRRN